MSFSTASFRRRDDAFAEAETPALRVRFSAAAFIVATMIQTASIPATGFVASAWQGAPVNLMMGGNLGDSDVMIFIAQWWYAGLLFAGPLALAGLLQRPLMNRLGWTGAWSFALLGLAWGTPWTFFALHAGLYGVGVEWSLTAHLLFAACLAPFALAHALAYRALGGVTRA